MTGRRTARSRAELERKLNIYRIVRYGMVIALFIVVIVALSGNRESKAVFDEVSAAVAGSISTDNAAKSPVRYLKKNFGLNAEDYEGVLIYTPTTNMHANEMLLIKLRDTSQADSVRAAIEERISSQLNIFEGYAPDEVNLLNNAIVDVRGNYIFYITDDNAQKADEVFRKSL